MFQSLVQVQPGVDIIRTNLEFLQEQFNSIAAHVLHCTGEASTAGERVCWLCWTARLMGLSHLPADSGFGARLLELCNQGLFECLALNLHCLGGQQMELAAVINGRIVSTVLWALASSLCLVELIFLSRHCTCCVDVDHTSRLKVQVGFLTLSVACLVE